MAMICLNEAHRHIKNLQPLQPVAIPLEKTLGLVCAENTSAIVNCPTADSSLKDGFAVVSEDIIEASPLNPIRLSIAGVVAASEDSAALSVTPGHAI
jgi:molybdopterin molybdotransferase